MSKILKLNNSSLFYIKQEDLVIFFIAVYYSAITYRIFFYQYSFMSQLMIFMVFLVGVKGLVYNIVNSSEEIKILLTFNFIIVSFLFFYSLLFQGNEPNLILRFFLITNLLILAFFYPASKRIVNVFLGVIFLHAIFIIGFEIFMVMNFELKTYGPIRFYINGLGIGDVYTFDGKFWRIQLAGNHSLPLALFISIVLLKGRMRFLLSSIFLLASILSGHFAFLISIFFFLFLYLVISMKISWNNLVKYLLVLFFIGAIAFKPTADYVEMILERKSQGSLSTRGDQANVLFSDLSNTIYELFLGKGLGNTVNVETKERNYKNKIYYELQGLYMFNQWGFAYGTFFILMHLLLLYYKLWDKKVLLVYASFMLYASTNPYSFDSSHVATIILLLSLKKHLQYNKDNRCLKIE